MQFDKTLQQLNELNYSYATAVSLCGSCLSGLGIAKAPNSDISCVGSIGAGGDLALHMQQLAAWQRSQKQLASKVMCKLGSCYYL